ncbi:MAG: alpha-mannosidase [Candidatus Hydrogenedentes bacterium]|nr:alpha-mannosidase [Candidatus Hydrogenedentota bacterium]
MQFRACFVAVAILCVLSIPAYSETPPDFSAKYVFAVGQSHIDAAWRWPWAETHEVLDDTFRQACDFMDEIPDFTYTQSSAAYFQDVERRNPELFARIKKNVAAGRFELVGGTWVESDLNIPSGEALVRQFLYGQKYFQEKFGVVCKIGWAPDTFGIPATYPQIAAKSGMDAMLFVRCGPDTPTFIWEGPDGTRLLTYSPEVLRKGLDDLDVNPFASLDNMKKLFEMVYRLSNTDAFMFPYGVGDHGGGPTRTWITMLKGIGQLPGGPKMHLSTAQQAFEHLAKSRESLPVLKREFNPTFEGCYTAHSDMKRRNRKNEILLQDAEKLSAMAMVNCKMSYPGKIVAALWEPVLFNQFHDILPGTAVREAYEEADSLYDHVERVGNDLCAMAKETIAGGLDTQTQEGLPVVVFNTLSWTRSGAVTVKLDYPKAPKRLVARDAAGNSWPAQVVDAKDWYEKAFYRCSVRFVARDVPPFSAKCFWISEPPAGDEPAAMVSLQDWTIENEYLRATLNPETGFLSSVFDKQQSREMLGETAPDKTEGNVFTLQEDNESPGNFWGWYTSWRMKLLGEPRRFGKPVSVEPLWKGPVSAAFRVRYVEGNSRFEQDVILSDGVPWIEFHTVADWREHRTTLRVQFPVSVQGETYTAHIPYGVISRPCDGAEMPAQRWIDLSGPQGGVALLNDCKYGQGVERSTLRLTLLRSSTDPDPVADVGLNEFTYALLTHAGDWRTANVMRAADELNVPLLALAAERHPGPYPGAPLFEIAADNVIIETVKNAEDARGIVIRLYETSGERIDTELVCSAPWTKVEETDFLERKQRDIAAALVGAQLRVPITLGPHEIKTFCLGIG